MYHILSMVYRGHLIGHFWGHMLSKKILWATSILFGKIRGQFEKYDECINFFRHLSLKA